MADFYWVGSSGNWSDYATRWATTSGGSTFHTNAPTSADNVFFDNSSAAGTFTVTVDALSNCANFDASGITSAAKKMTLAGSQALRVFGSWTNPTSTYYASTFTGALTFASTSSGNTITTNSVSMTTGALTFDGVGGAWTLGGALTYGGSFTLTNGSFNTSGSNYNVTGGSFSSNNTNTRTLTLNSSTVSASGNVTFTTTTNLTFSGASSTITVPSGTIGFNGGGLTFGTVSFTSTNAGTTTITGANTYTTLTFTKPASAGLRNVSFDADQTVSGTVTFGGTSSAVRRMFVFSNTLGTQRTITAGTLATLTDTDFRDIKAAGASAPWSGTRVGDAQGNSSITADNAKTVYWNLSGAQNWSADGWATTNNGTPATANFPLPQDTAVFTEAGAAGTVTINANWHIGSIQMADGASNRSTAFTLATGATTPTIYGNVTLFSSLTLSGTGALTFSGRTTQTVTPAGISFTQPVTINAPSGAVTLSANWTLGSSLAFTLTAGSLNLNGKTLSVGTFASAGSNTRAIAFGTSGKLTINGSGSTAFSASGSGLTTSGSSSTIDMVSASAKTFAGGGYTYAAKLNQGGAGALTITGANTFADIGNTTQPATITFPASATTTFTSAFSLAGTSGNLVTIQSSSAGTRAFLSKSSGVINVSYLSIKDTQAQGGANWNALTTSPYNNVDGGNNIGWHFLSVAGYGGPFVLDRRRGRR